MKAAILDGSKNLEIRDIKKPIPKNNEVLIKVAYVGICGSDVHYYEHGRIGDFIVDSPLILGHECSGEIIELGNDVKKYKIGDKVVVEPGYGCNTCDFCKKGQYNLCDKMTFMATPPINGAFAEYITYKEDMIFPLPESMSLIEGALIEPLAIGIYAASKGSVQPNQKVLVQGAGCIGLVSMMACMAYGTKDITVTDVLDVRLQKASELGAKKVVNVKSEKLDIFDFDVVIDCVGLESTMKTAIDHCKKGATIVLVGMGTDGDIPVNINRAISKELQFQTIFRYKNIFKTAIKLVEEKQIDLKSIVSNVFDFSDIKKAFKFVIEHRDKVTKAVIKM